MKWIHNKDGNYLDGERFIIYRNVQQKRKKIYLLQDLQLKDYPCNGSLEECKSFAANRIKQEHDNERWYE